LSLGPKDYHGLPGLVIELQEGDLSFFAQKIKLNSIILKPIEKPIKGKEMSLEEYNKMVKNLFSNKKRN